MTSVPSIGMAGTQIGSRQAPCNCPPQTPPQPCCCNLVCFDRPNYFCGHLLTDADLTLQQRYVLEKNKLYHRTLDGYGVVCGLKLTCDCDCKGNILVHDGFAIDDCGNDLVVCETTRFDVIAALKAKGLLIVEPEEDDCEPRRRERRCEIKQCFYVTICYQETDSCYETPFQSSCTAGPKQCLPTRIHEGVRFDVTDRLPQRPSYLEEILRRIRECFEVNCDSPIGVLLKRHTKELLAVFGEGEDTEGEWRFNPCELFCTLRAYFLNHLKVKPDEFNCGLHEEVACINCPVQYREEHHQRDGGRESQKHHREEVREAFGRLLFCMQRYQYDCVFGDLIFSCQQPCEADCLVLGTVEVVDGRLTRVNNLPRRYLWAPANLLQVATHQLMTGRLAEDCDGADRRGREAEGKHDVDDRLDLCCPVYPRFNPTRFLRELEVNECGRRFAAESAIEGLQEFARSLHHSFDFTDSMAYAPKLFARLLEKSKGEAQMDSLGVRTHLSNTTASELSALNPWQALLSKALLRPGDVAQGFKSPQGIHILPDFFAMGSPEPSVRERIDTQFKDHARQVAELRAEIEQLKRRLPDGGEPDKAPKKPK